LTSSYRALTSARAARRTGGRPRFLAPAGSIQIVESFESIIEALRRLPVPLGSTYLPQSFEAVEKWEGK
jgi:hypothetical protein